MEIKPLDFVRTPSGNVAIVTEISNTQGILKASVTFIGKPQGYDYNAWHPVGDLEYLDNLPNILTCGLVHPFSSHKEFNSTFFKRDIL